MTIICIAGHSGSGKSEVTKSLIEHLPNTVLIDGDKYMFQWMAEHLEDFKDVFGISKEKCDLKECMDIAKQMTSEQFRKFVYTSAPFIEKGIENELCNLCEYNKLYVIIEWMGIPMFKVWARSEYRIIVNSSFEQRREKLLERTLKEGKAYKEDPATIRTPCIEEILKIVKDVDFVLNNTYNEYFSLECKRVCDKILAKNDCLLNCKLKYL